MTFWIGFSWVFVFAAFSGLIGMVAWMLLRRRRATLHANEDAPEFKIVNYRPMERLLSGDELDFLSRQPGYRPEIGARWKRERRRLFRMYFRDLKRDFRRLHAESRELVARADADSADLVHLLMRQRWTFILANAKLEYRLALAWAGIGHVDAAPLVDLLEAMRANISRLGALQAELPVGAR